MSKGYSIEVYCHTCIQCVVKVGPYAVIEELMEDAEEMMQRHESKVHPGPKAVDK
jgi:hypothetical protein